jgi:hypothetical protein
MKTGTKIIVPNFLYAPVSYTADSLAHPVKHVFGHIAEELSNGAVGVKFDGYPNIVDYTAKEVRHFIKI